MGQSGPKSKRAGPNNSGPQTGPLHIIHIKILKRNLRSWMTESIITVFQHQTQSTIILCILDPLTSYHPGWISHTFTSNHEKDWTTFFVKCVIHKISLLYTQNSANCCKCKNIKIRRTKYLHLHTVQVPHKKVCFYHLFH